jgi:hypothetical protein
MKPEFLNQVLEDATVHQETQGARLEYDTSSFYLTAEYNTGKTHFTYEAYDSDNDRVILKPKQMTQIYEFVKGLYQTEKNKEKELKNQF